MTAEYDPALLAETRCRELAIEPLPFRAHRTLAREKHDRLDAPACFDCLGTRFRLAAAAWLVLAATA